MRNNMAHEVETMAWANDVPWHGLGRKVNSDLTPDQILLHADLDWKVQMKPVQWTNQDNVIMSSDKYFSLVREAHERIDGTQVPEQIVGTQWVTDQYNIIQNSRQAQFFKEYIDAGMATMETAISLFGGRIVVLMAKTNNSFEAAYLGASKMLGPVTAASLTTVAGFAPVFLICVPAVVTVKPSRLI